LEAGLQMPSISPHRLIVAVVGSAVVPALLIAQAPVPGAIKIARTVYLENQASDLKAQDELAKQLGLWGRLEVVDSREKADLIVTLAKAETGTTKGVAVPAGQMTFAKSKQQQAFIMSVQVRPTDEAVWSDSETIGKYSTYGGIQNLVTRLKERLERSVETDATDDHSAIDLRGTWEGSFSGLSAPGPLEMKAELQVNYQDAGVLDGLLKFTGGHDPAEVSTVKAFVSGLSVEIREIQLRTGPKTGRLYTSFGKVQADGRQMSGTGSDGRGQYRWSLARQ
jgi:hypothetical protein